MRNVLPSLLGLCLLCLPVAIQAGPPAIDHASSCGEKPAHYVCVEEVKKTTKSHDCFDEKTKMICVRPCFGFFCNLFSGKKGCDGGHCCKLVKTRLLVKRTRKEEICEVKCKAVEAPACEAPACEAPCLPPALPCPK